MNQYGYDTVDQRLQVADPPVIFNLLMRFNVLIANTAMTLAYRAVTIGSTMGVQAGANSLYVAQHVRISSSADSKRNHQIGCRVLSINRHPPVHQAQKHQHERHNSHRDRVGPPSPE